MDLGAVRDEKRWSRAEMANLFGSRDTLEINLVYAIQYKVRKDLFHFNFKEKMDFYKPK